MHSTFAIGDWVAYPLARVAHRLENVHARHGSAYYHYACGNVGQYFRVSRNHRLPKCKQCVAKVGS